MIINAEFFFIISMMVLILLVYHRYIANALGFEKLSRKRFLILLLAFIPIVRWLALAVLIYLAIISLEGSPKKDCKVEAKSDIMIPEIRRVDMTENFIAKFYSPNHKIVTTKLNNREIISITILPNNRSGSKIYIWNENYVKDIPEDTPDMYEFEFNVLESLLMKGSAPDIIHLFNYFLKNDAHLSLTIDYGDKNVLYLNLEMVDNPLQEILKPQLIGLDIINAISNDNLAIAIDRVLQLGEKVCVKDVSLYYENIIGEENYEEV